MDKNFTYLNTKKQDLYQHLAYQFEDHIGQFWSWCEGGVQCPYGYTSKTNTIFLRGYVDPQSVDWVDTLYKQCYSLQDEKEIFVAYNEPIEITEITYQGKRFPLRNSIIVKA